MYSLIAILAFNALHLFVIHPMVDYQMAEVFGYLTMTLGMIFVFFGVKHYRDRVNNGSLTFGEGLKIGLLITLGPSLVFALFDMFYVEVINPSYQDDYYADLVARTKANTPPDQLAGKLKTMEKQKEFFNNPVLLFLVMFLTVFIIGTIVSIISALTLRRKKRVPATY